MRISPSSGYAYWGGTSFAAPLVSGLAALVLEQNDSISSQEVYDRIEGRAIVQPDGALGAGIVDVPNTLKP
jgi:subtilisin family serine protease